MPAQATLIALAGPLPLSRIRLRTRLRLIFLPCNAAHFREPLLQAFFEPLLSFVAAGATCEAL